MLPHFDPVRTWALIAAIAMVEVRSALRVHGARGTLVRSVRHVGDLFKLRRAQRVADIIPDGFDATHGVNTEITMNLRELLDVARRGGAEHTPTPSPLLRELLAALDIPFEETVFIDFGSGAGRAVLLAAEHPFKAIIGVELCASLHQRAEANLRAYRNPAQRCHEIHLHCGDAAEFTLPDDPLVLYFYNPFRGDVMRRVLDNIEGSLAAHPRPITVIHLAPRPETLTMFQASGGFTLTDTGTEMAMFRSVARPPSGAP